MEFVLAALFALIAGFGTAFSPCVLPVLPLALGGAATGGRRRPLGIAVGLAASFAFATLALAYVIAALGLPDDLLRDGRDRRRCSCFGVVPGRAAARRAARGVAVAARAGARGAAAAATGSARASCSARRSGLLYVPCAGPILAAVLTVQASQALSAQRLVTGLAYAVGTGGGRAPRARRGPRLLGRLRANAGRLQMAMGVVMVALRGADADRRRRPLPDRASPTRCRRWLVSPTGEDRGRPRGRRARRARPGLQDAGPAPELRGTQEWFNSEPLTLPGCAAASS